MSFKGIARSSLKLVFCFGYLKCNYWVNWEAKIADFINWGIKKLIVTI